MPNKFYYSNILKFPKKERNIYWGNRPSGVRGSLVIYIPNWHPCKHTRSSMKINNRLLSIEDWRGNIIIKDSIIKKSVLCRLTSKAAMSKLNESIFGGMHTPCLPTQYVVISGCRCAKPIIVHEYLNTIESENSSVRLCRDVYYV